MHFSYDIAAPIVPHTLQTTLACSLASSSPLALPHQCSNFNACLNILSHSIEPPPERSPSPRHPSNDLQQPPTRPRPHLLPASVPAKPSADLSANNSCIDCLSQHRSRPYLWSDPLKTSMSSAFPSLSNVCHRELQTGVASRSSRFLSFHPFSSVAGLPVLF